jgi:hypothetical protein
VSSPAEKIGLVASLVVAVGWLATVVDDKFDSRTNRERWDAMRAAPDPETRMEHHVCYVMANNYDWSPARHDECLRLYAEDREGVTT